MYCLNKCNLKLARGFKFTENDRHRNYFVITMSSQKISSIPSIPAETDFSPVGSPPESHSSSLSQVYSHTNLSSLSSTQLSYPCTLPLEFHRHIFEELLSEDGLLILSRGLGLRRIICALLKIYSDKESLVILLNANGHELNFIKEELAECGVKKPGLRVVNNETNSKER